MNTSLSKIQSVGWIIYRIDKKTNTPLFFLMKRQAMSKKIERIAPKGKIEWTETLEKTVLREIQEETWLLAQNMDIKKKLWTLSIQLLWNEGSKSYEKDITYFFIQYHGDASAITIQDAEWFTGQYTWAEIDRALNLITYKDLRELYRDAFLSLSDISSKAALINKLF